MDNFHEFAMELLRWKKGTSAQPHALLVTSDLTFAACAVATPVTRPGTGTAIVNLLQGAISLGIDPTGAYIYSTAAPDWACTGMARLQTRGGYIFYPGDAGLKCWCAHRTNYGPVEARNWRWEWSRFARDWNALAPGGDSVATWAGKIKDKTRYGGSNSFVTSLQNKCSAAATKVESLTVLTGRSPVSLQKFFDPKAIGTFEIVEQMRTPAERDEFYSLLAQELVYRLRGRVQGSVRDHQAGHNIGSVMVDAQGRLVGWAVNTNKLNGTYHGETNLVQANEAHGNATLPPGGAMYTSLEPCEMCSGVIRSALADGDKAFRVLYIQADATLGGTALKDHDPPIKMSASKAASTGGTIAKGVVFGDELARRQGQLARRDQSYKAPTTFLRDPQALGVFDLAGRQRVTMSGPHAQGAAQLNVQSEANAAAAHEQLRARRTLQAGLNVSRPVQDIVRYTGGYARDDLDLLPIHRMSLGLPEPRLPRDDFSIGLRPPRPVDPVLVKLAKDLDALSERFQGVFTTWMTRNGATRTSAEKARVLKQVTDFLDRAYAACMR